MALLLTGAPDTLRLGPGVHQGPLVITRPTVILGEPGAVLRGQRHGERADIAAPGTVVRGIRIEHGGRDVDRDDSGVMVRADSVTLEDCRSVTRCSASTSTGSAARHPPPARHRRAPRPAGEPERQRHSSATTPARSSSPTAGSLGSATACTSSTPTAPGCRQSRARRSVSGCTTCSATSICSSGTFSSGARPGRWS